MNNINNKQFSSIGPRTETKILNDLDNAIYILEHHLEGLEKSMPSNQYEADISTFMLYRDTKDIIKSLEELGKLVINIRKSELKGYHA